MANTPIQDGSPIVLNGIHTEHPSDVVTQATELLEQLCAARKATEQRLAEAGRFDPMKKITGRSSLDNAIERTEKLLEEMRSLSMECEQDEQSDPPYIEVNCNGLHGKSWSRTQTQQYALVQ